MDGRVKARFVKSFTAVNAAPLLPMLFVKQVAYSRRGLGLNLRNMVKTFSLYEASTGMFTGKRVQCDEDALLEMRLPPGTLTIEGSYDQMSQRVDLATGCVV